MIAGYAHKFGATLKGAGYGVEPAEPEVIGPAPVPVEPTPEPIVVEKVVVAGPEELGTPPAKSKTVWT